jgi:hypothetical protein
VECLQVAWAEWAAAEWITKKRILKSFHQFLFGLAPEKA